MRSMVVGAYWASIDGALVCLARAPSTAHRKSGLPDLRIHHAHPGQAPDAWAVHLPRSALLHSEGKQPPQSFQCTSVMSFDGIGSFFQRPSSLAFQTPSFGST